MNPENPVENFENQPENMEEVEQSDYERLVQVEIEKDLAIEEAEAVRRAEKILFEERIGQFTEGDLVKDADGSWSTFEQKVRDVFPEVPEDRFRAFKAAICMELCGL